MSDRIPTLVPLDIDLERIAERARRRFELAKAALTGLLACPHTNDEYRRRAFGGSKVFADEAVTHADALLARLDATARKDTPGDATAAGVAAPTVPLARWVALVEKVQQVADDICGVGSGVTVIFRRPEEWLDAIAREYHRVRVESARRDKPGAVMVTAAQRGAVVLAAGLYHNQGSEEVADELYGLLDAIDAAKGGGD